MKKINKFKLYKLKKTALFKEKAWQLEIIDYLTQVSSVAV